MWNYRSHLEYAPRSAEARWTGLRPGYSSCRTPEFIAQDQGPRPLARPLYDTLRSGSTTPPFSLGNIEQVPHASTQHTLSGYVVDKLEWNGAYAMSSKRSSVHVLGLKAVRRPDRRKEEVHTYLAVLLRSLPGQEEARLDRTSATRW